MTWHKTDDEFFDSAKLLPLEDDWRLWSDCIALWLAAGVFCSRSGTDGHIKRTRIARLTPMPEERAFEVAETLVELARKPGSEFGLWERNGDDYLFHDWLDYQPSAAEVAEKKAQNLKRQHRHRQQKRDGASRNALRNSDDYGYVTNESDDSEAVTNAVSHSPPSPTRSRSRPEPDPVPRGSPRGGAAGLAHVTAAVAAVGARQGSSTTATGIQAGLGDELSGMGYAVEFEAPVPDRGDGRPGRLDLIARGHGLVIAVEGDRLSPRGKSLAKLRSAAADLRVVVLRGRGASVPPAGIDAVLGLGWEGGDAQPVADAKPKRARKAKAAELSPDERAMAEAIATAVTTERERYGLPAVTAEQTAVVETACWCCAQGFQAAEVGRAVALRVASQLRWKCDEGQAQQMLAPATVLRQGRLRDAVELVRRGEVAGQPAVLARAGPASGQPNRVTSADLFNLADDFDRFREEEERCTSNTTSNTTS